MEIILDVIDVFNLQTAYSTHMDWHRIGIWSQHITQNAIDRLTEISSDLMGFVNMQATATSTHVGQQNIK